jgi:hypothetical protein
VLWERWLAEKLFKSPSKAIRELDFGVESSTVKVGFVRPSRCVFIHSFWEVLRVMRTKLFLSLTLLGLVGCGSGVNSIPVTGKVTLDGTPISGAVITFQPVEGGTGMPAVGTTDSSGQYTVTDMRSESLGSGAVAGEYKVGVMWYKPDPNDTSQATGETAGDANTDDDKASHQQVSGPDSLLPVAYNSPDSSGLTASVKAGSSTFDFDLVSSFKGAGGK